MNIEINTLQNIRDGRVKLEIIIDPAELDAQVSYDPEQAADTMAANYVRACQRITELEAELARTLDTSEYYVRTIDSLKAEREKVQDLDVAMGTLKVREEQVGLLKAELDEAREQAQELREELADAYKRNMRTQDAVNGRDLAIGELRTVRQQLDEAREQAQKLREKLADAEDARTSMNNRRIGVQDRLSDVERALANQDRLLHEATLKLGAGISAVHTVEVNDALEHPVQDLHTRWSVLAEAVRTVRKVLNATPDATSQA